MKITGIIAEYNPFHNGHAYQIEQVKKQADYVIVAMSGDFVQRGTCAILDKYQRAKMALSCGADLVLELPVAYATASAEFFAWGGVSLLHACGIVQQLCFGAEDDNLEFLTQAAALLCNEPPAFQEHLRAQLKQGESFATARASALSLLLSPKGCDVSKLLSRPNNILALEYLKALQQLQSPIVPFLLPRTSDNYHDSSISGHFSSATALRKCLFQNEVQQLETLMPPNAYQILIESHQNAPWVSETQLSQILGYQLLQLAQEENPDIFTAYGGCNLDLSRRIYKCIPQYREFTQFCSLLKTKQLAYTYVQRVLLHILLGISSQMLWDGKHCAFPYLRVLGVRKESTGLLSLIQEQGSAPLVTSLSKAKKQLSTNAYSYLKKDIFAADLYTQLQRYPDTPSQACQTELTQRLLVL